MEKIIKYPIGEQSFEWLRKEGCVYVDKTGFISKMILSGNKYYFLGRPRRFGKSLFLSTLQCFFEGKREFFKGLAVDNLDWDWTPYPVLHIDLNTRRYEKIGQLDSSLDLTFKEWESKYDVKQRSDNLSDRFRLIIEAAHKITGRPVVILVDEYDKPLVGNLNEKENFDHYRANLASIYSNFKSSADHIRMVFLTGVSRFSKLSIFSDLNNLQDITFANMYADICGITEVELRENFNDGSLALAEKYGVSQQEIFMLLKKNYDGYRFAEEGSEIYNPWSLLNALSLKKIANYWNNTGFPSLIVESLKNLDVDLKDYLDTVCTQDELNGLDLDNPNPLALLYQTGYLTIKDYDPLYDEYRVGIPNEEVKTGLFELLLPLYAKMPGRGTSFQINEFVKEFRRGDVDAFMKRLRSFFASISYDMEIEDERNLHNALYVFIVLLGLKVQAEARTSDGRIDLLVKTEKYVYIIELKYDKSAESALSQIERKEYSLPFACDDRKIIAIGANFDPSTRRISDDWKVL